MANIHPDSILSHNYARILHEAVSSTDPVAAARILRVIHEGCDDPDRKEVIRDDLKKLGSSGLLAVRVLEA